MLTRLEALSANGSAFVGDVTGAIQVSIAEMKRVWARAMLDLVNLGKSDARIGGLAPSGVHFCRSFLSIDLRSPYTLLIAPFAGT